MKLLIVDDHPVMRFGVRQLIERHWPQATIAEAASLAEASATSRSLTRAERAGTCGADSAGRDARPRA